MDSIIYIAKCFDYRPADIYRHLCQFFQYNGGIRKYVKPGMKVLIKPNLCKMHPPGKAVTSHPVVLEQIVTIMQEQGADVTVGDNPIGQPGRDVMDKIWQVCGINEVAARTGCHKSKLDKDGLKKETLQLKGNLLEYFISKEYLNADLVINVPKFKTHMLVGFTGAVKNMLGIVPGRSKGQLHRFAPEREDFAKVLAEVFSKRIPQLTIMDAIEGLEGDGPTTRGIPRKIGLLMISNDGVLVDSLCTQLMGLEIDQVLTNYEARQRGLGNSTPTRIYLNGFNALEECHIKDFKLPALFNYSNPSMIKKLFELSKLIISIDKDTCIHCLKCMENCPLDIIQKIDNTLSIDDTKCIQCMCCFEICPVGAVSVSKSNFYQQLKELKKRKSKDG